VGRKTNYLMEDFEMRQNTLDPNFPPLEILLGNIREKS